MVYVFLMYTFKRMVCTSDTPGFFYFLYTKCLSSIYTEDKSGGNDLRVTGGVETFAC